MPGAFCRTRSIVTASRCVPVSAGAAGAAPFGAVATTLFIDEPTAGLVVEEWIALGGDCRTMFDSPNIFAAMTADGWSRYRIARLHRVTDARAASGFSAMHRLNA
jgi:hypothetical protein